MAQPPVPRPRLWPILLISSALLLLALGAVAVGQMYWNHMHVGMVRLRQSIDEASHRQVVLAEQVRDAQAGLRARHAELDRREAELTGCGVAGEAAVSKDQLSGRQHGPRMIIGNSGVSGRPLPATVDRIDRRRLRGLLAAIAKEAVRLPPSRRAQRPRIGSQAMPRGGAFPLSAKLLIKAQLQVADAALNMGDLLLLDVAAEAAQRFLGDLYPVGDLRTRDLGALIGELRSELRLASPPTR
ncbi:MAG: hypothetical protein WBG92_24050 [Thiohalocapsa sp.]